MTSGKDAIERAEVLQPDVALIDIEMPKMDGLTTTRVLSRRFPDIKILVLSGYDSMGYVRKALNSGAKGYLLKTTSGGEIVTAIRSVNEGYYQFGPGLLDKFIDEDLKNETISPDDFARISKIFERILSKMESLGDRISRLEKDLKIGAHSGVGNRLNQLESDRLNLLHQLNGYDRKFARIRIILIGLSLTVLLAILLSIAIAFR
jgi:CheY-like chemotaxis protein